MSNNIDYYGLNVNVTTPGKFRNNICEVDGCQEHMSFLAGQSIFLCKKHAAILKLIREDIALDPRIEHWVK